MTELIDSSTIKVSNETEKTFSDMPFEILAKIVEYLNFRSQIKLRRVSHGLQQLVDRGKPSIYEIHYEIEDNLGVKFYYNISSREQISGHYTDHQKENVFNDLAILLNNHRLRLKSFEWVNKSSHPELDQKLINLMSSLDRKLEITYLRLKSQLNEDSLIAVLDKVKIKTLKKIEIESSHPSINIDRIANLDQWRQAETVFLNYNNPDFSRVFHHFHHFKSFVINSNAISIEDLLNMRKIFSGNINFRYCFIYTENKPTIEDMKAALDLDENGVCTIPNSNNGLQFRASARGIQVNTFRLEDF